MNDYSANFPIRRWNGSGFRPTFMKQPVCKLRCDDPFIPTLAEPVDDMMRRTTDVALVGSAASPDDSEPWQGLKEITVKLAELVGVAGIQFLGLIQFFVTHAAGIGADSTDA